MKNIMKKILCLFIAFCTILGGSSLFSTFNALTAQAEERSQGRLAPPVAREAEALPEEVQPEEMEEEPVLSTYFFTEDDEKTVAVNIGPYGALPEDAVLVVRDLTPDSFEQKDRDVYAWADSALQQYCEENNKTAENFFIYDIHFEVNGEYTVPNDTIQISIIYKNDDRDIRRFVDSGALSVMHFDNSTGVDILTDVNAEIYPSDLGTTAITFDLYNHDLYPYVICVLQDYIPEETTEEETTSSITYEDIQPMIISMDETNPEEQNSGGTVYYNDPPVSEGEPEGGDDQEVQPGEGQDNLIQDDQELHEQQNSGQESQDQVQQNGQEQQEDQDQKNDQGQQEGQDQVIRQNEDSNENENSGTPGTSVITSNNEEESEQTETGGRSLITMDEEEDAAEEENPEGSRRVVLYEDENGKEDSEVINSEDAEKEDGEVADGEETDKEDGVDTDTGGAGKEGSTAANIVPAPAVPEPEEEVRERRIYSYEDDYVEVTAILQRADAVPDDAILVVTPVVQDSEGYNYDAYMDALNDASDESKEYTSENTLLYDIAFMVPVYELVPMDGAGNVTDADGAQEDAAEADTEAAEAAAGTEGAADAQEQYAQAQADVQEQEIVSDSVAAPEAGPVAESDVPEGAEGGEEAAEAIEAEEPAEESEDTQQAPVASAEPEIPYEKVLVGYYEYEPEAGAVTIVMNFKHAQLSQELNASDGDEIEVTHLSADVQIDNTQITSDDITPETVDASVDVGTGDNVLFTTDSFSVYAFSYTVVERVIDASGDTYEVTLTYDSNTGIPAGAQLDVLEILPETEEYQEYVRQTEAALGWEEGSASYVKLFDISIVDGEDPDTHYQPADGTSVNVSVRLLDKDQEKEDTQVVHFPDEAEEPEILDNTVEGDTVNFESGSFSVYAIVEAPEPAEPDIKTVKTLAELAENTDQGFYMSVTRSNITSYFTSSFNSNSCFTLSSASSAATWYFEKISEESNNQYYIYTLIDGAKNYITNPSGNLAGLLAFNDNDTPDTRTVFTVSQPAAGLFLLKISSANKWLQYSGSGGGIRYWTDAKNSENSRITLSYAESFSLPKDPYALDGMTYGIAYHNADISAVALSNVQKTVSGQSRLSGDLIYVMPDVVEHNGIYLVSGVETEGEDTDIVSWTFHSIEEDRYFITTEVDGADRYLTINGVNVTLEEEPDEKLSAITVTPGSGEHAGELSFSVNGYYLNLPNATGLDSIGNKKAISGFNGSSSQNAQYWMNLLEKDSFLSNSSFKHYEARKVSVSDSEKITTGALVILYTRIWNEETREYEFYAVDYDGTLIRIYDDGDVVEWIGGSINTATWYFTEYIKNEKPTYYYELQNVYAKEKQYDSYLAPQLKDSQILSSDTIGLNLNGRRYGDDYTTILAWDDGYYAYAGLKASDGKVTTSSLGQADDFYFAIVDTSEVEELTTVATIDHTAFGIKMHMVDFQNPVVNNRDSYQNGFFNGDNNVAGLLSTDLQADGFPKTTGKTGAEQSLGNLFAGMSAVNQLFLQGTYNESGYFEYDSTQNFAHLNENGTFTVYDQIAAIGTSDRATRQHGQFMPFNEIQAGVVAPVTNQTDVYANELSDSDPRKNEQLYLITDRDADYFFGMEMEASFAQTPNGLDAWGHDIIFEFSGDDDFWLYVDGELVLDLGGVHSASTGKVNFRTGTVDLVVKDKDGKVLANRTRSTTLKNLFEENYRARGLSEQEIAEKLDYCFTTNANGQYVFKDYTRHDMKIFYMERGAGASNLHMRFNLAAVKPNTVVLSKKISGTDKQDYNLAEFPYQVYYKYQTDGEKDWHQLKEKTDGNSNVTYSGKSTPVRYEETYKPAGGTTEYSDVFFLKPGESADIRLPDDTTVYYIVECGINQSIYDEVKANEVPLEGKDEDSENRLDNRFDYAVEPATMDSRPRVEYNNHVSENAIRTLNIKKVLYAEDGRTVLSSTEDPASFSFRLRLGNENVPDDELELVNLYPYHIKDESGNYCYWDYTQQSFVSLNETTWSALTEAQQNSATFNTSSNGQISRIPSGYSVEVRDLLVGTKFMVEEWDSDIPAGYTLKEYFRVEGSYITEDGDTLNSGVIRDNSDPAIEVHNQRGWGLTVKKDWSDKEYMQSHDPIYFAVYTADNNGTLTILPGTLKQMTEETAKDTDGLPYLYWYFDSLEKADIDQYVIREVTIGNTHPSVNGDGTVSDPGSVSIIGQGETLTVDATLNGSSSSDSYTYTASYSTGDATGVVKNARTDIVTNARNGIRIVKEDWSGNPLGGAVFILREKNAESGRSYTSTQQDGYVTTVYANGEYELEEIQSPDGYQGLPSTLSFAVEDGKAKLAVNNEKLLAYCSVSQAQDEIIIKNKPFTLKAVKVDENGTNVLPGAHFELYRQVTDAAGNPGHDYYPMTGYADLVSDINGVIPGITEGLNPGTYYLHEITAPAGYVLPDGNSAPYLCFTITDTGIVTIETHNSWDLEQEDQDGVVNYTISVKNKREVTSVRAAKTWNGSEEWPRGASVTFTLYYRDNNLITTEENNRGTEVESKTIRYDDSDKTAVWNDLPVYSLSAGENGTVTAVKRTYSVYETAVAFDGNTVDPFRDVVYEIDGEGPVSSDTAIIIDNKDVMTDVTVTKEWVNSSNTAPDGAVVRLTLYKGTSEANANESVSSVLLNGTAEDIEDDNQASPPANKESLASAQNSKTAYESDPWTAHWTDLKAYENGQKLYYVVKEESAVIQNGDASAALTGYEQSYEGAGSSSAEYTVDGGKVVNTLAEIEIQIKKVDAADAKPLSAAKFQLKKESEPASDGTKEEAADGTGDEPEQTDSTPNYETVEDEAIVDTDGMYVFSHLTDGIYQLIELTPPEGYNGISEPITFVISAGRLAEVNGKPIDTIAPVSIENNNLVSATPASSDEPGTIIIGNVEGVAMPATGGIGTHLLYILGALLAALGSVLLILRMRKKSR